MDWPELCNFICLSESFRKVILSFWVISWNKMIIYVMIPCLIIKIFIPLQHCLKRQTEIMIVSPTKDITWLLCFWQFCPKMDLSELYLLRLRSDGFSRVDFEFLLFPSSSYMWTSSRLCFLERLSQLKSIFWSDSTCFYYKLRLADVFKPN